jgi:hypothetical protein
MDQAETETSLTEPDQHYRSQCCRSGIRCFFGPLDPDPGSGMEKIWIRDENLVSYFEELSNTYMC